MLIYLPLLVAFLGVLMYGFSANAKVQEIGRIMIGCGTLAYLLTTAAGHAPVSVIH